MTEPKLAKDLNEALELRDEDEIDYPESEEETEEQRKEREEQERLEE